MSWLALVISGLLETAWAVALHESIAQPRWIPITLFAVALAASMAGLAIALRELPIGTAYAVWVGIGAVGTVTYGVLAQGDPASAARLVCVGAILAGVIGLKVAA